MKELFWKIAARLGFWIPVDKYKPKGWVFLIIDYYGIPFGKIACWNPIICRWIFPSYDSEFDETYWKDIATMKCWHRLPKIPKCKKASKK